MNQTFDNVRLDLCDCFELLDAIAPDSVDCIWTDPPYNLSNGGTTCQAGKRVSVNKGDWDVSQGVETDLRWHINWLNECYRVLKPGGSIWVSGTMHVIGLINYAMQSVGYRLINDIIWEKKTPPPNLGCRCFTHSTETLLWAVKPGDRYTFNYDDMKAENGGKQMKSVWTFSAPGKAEKALGKHPTQKPLALVDRCLRATTNPGDLVLDPFAGSGTTAVAALTLGRRFLGCERDRDYWNLAGKRINQALAINT